MRLPRYSICGLIALLAALSGWAIQAAQGQGLDRQKVVSIKAAYLLRFVEYTQWPEDCFADRQSPLVITLVGDCDFYTVLREQVRDGGSIGGRRIAVQKVDYPKANVRGVFDEVEVEEFYQVLQRSHAVYFCTSSGDSLRPVLRRLEGRNVLTVSDAARFCEYSGMLGLVIRENRMVFQANTGEIKKTDLAVSAKMLKLAEIVQTRPTNTAGAEVNRP